MKRVICVGLLWALMLGSAAALGHYGEDLYFEAGGVSYGYNTWSEDLHILSVQEGVHSIAIPAQVQGHPVDYTHFRYEEDPSIVIEELVVDTDGLNLLMGLNAQDQPAYVRTVERLVFTEAVTSLPSDAAKFPNLREYVVSPENAYFCDKDGVLFSKDGTWLVAYPPGKGDSYTIPAHTRGIDSWAFPETMSLLAYEEGITVVTEDLKPWPVKVGRLEIPGSVFDLSGLDHEWALRSALWVPEDHPYFELREGLLYRRADGTLLNYPYLDRESVEVPLGTEGIARYAFNAQGYNSNETVRSLSLPRGIASIEGRTFCSFWALERVSLPLTLEHIGAEAFRECIALSDIVLPQGLQSIGALAFAGCDSLAGIYIPDSVTSIDPSAFDFSPLDQVIYASEGSEGHRYARMRGKMWAEPGGEPVRAEPLDVALIHLTEDEGLQPMYASPSREGGILGQYPNGTTVWITDTQKDWAAVWIGEHRGYMPAEVLLPAPENLAAQAFGYIVQASKEYDEDSDYYDQYGFCDLYAYPTRDAAVRVAYHADALIILDVVGSWLYVNNNEDVNGYLPVEEAYSLSSYSYYLTEEGPLPLGFVAHPDSRIPLPLYAGPGEEHPVLGRYFNGTRLEILAFQEDWLHVLMEGQEGYVRRECILTCDDWLDE